MGDSDEEYDRRHRDKFRQERTDYQERGREKRGRDGRSSRRIYRDYKRNRGSRYSPPRHYISPPRRDISPPMKRMRRDWDDPGGSYGRNFDGSYPGSGMMGGMHSGKGMHGQMSPQRDVVSGLTQPPMMTIKEFLKSQDDRIDDQEAVKKYNEYKLEFKRQQINEFFLKHKDEEWFKLKHHPEESLKRRAALKRRLAVFMELIKQDWVDFVSVDQENNDQIIQFLDAVAIKLKDGTDFDRKALDKPYKEEKLKDPTPYLLAGKNSRDDCKDEKLRDSELGAIVNRDLSPRIRSVNGISSDKQVVSADIKLAARIIQNLDRQNKLWDEEDKEEELDERGFPVIYKNPLLKNITDYLIEEASAEEDELLGMGDSDETKEGGESCELERDEALIKVLDRLLLYLRAVHSVDYYNSSEYPNEDGISNGCRIMHARGLPPSGRVMQQDIDNYISHFQRKSRIFLQSPAKLDDEEYTKLGKKDPSTEVGKFIQTNTQEQAKDKWICSLCSKKFKGPEFVRKHIYNKHAEKIKEVKIEVEYFNNYLMDPKTAELPEDPSNRNSGSETDNTHMGNIGEPPFHSEPFPPPMPPYRSRGPGPNFPGFGRQNYGRGPDKHRSGYGKRNFQRPYTDPREIIGYHDLDAPQDEDYF